MEGANGETIPTRAILEAADVKAPTLYHHFGNKAGLLDAVVTHGFKEHLRTHGGADGGNPVDVIRQGWDTHVRFGLEHPYFYVYVYGQVRPGEPCGVIGDVQAMVLEALLPAARDGRLAVTPAQAAAQLVSASAGVTLTLINQRAEERDPDLSARVREAVLAAILAPGSADEPPAGAPSRLTGAAVALELALNEPDAPLSPTELALLREWLGRLKAG